MVVQGINDPFQPGRRPGSTHRDREVGRLGCGEQRVQGSTDQLGPHADVDDESSVSSAFVQVEHQRRAGLIDQHALEGAEMRRYRVRVRVPATGSDESAGKTEFMQHQGEAAGTAVSRPGSTVTIEM